MGFLGQVYKDHQVSLVKVKECWEKAGEAGCGEACSRMAELFVEQRDWSQAKHCCELAADLNHVIALHTSAVEATCGYFSFGDEVVQVENRSIPDDEKALRLMKLAAKLDHPMSCACLGNFHKEGIGCEVNMDNAIKWCKKGAEQEVPWAMRNLGVACCLGDHVEQDNEASKCWLRKAAALNDVGAQRDLGQFCPSEG